MNFLMIIYFYGDEKLSEIFVWFDVEVINWKFCRKWPFFAIFKFLNQYYIVLKDNAKLSKIIIVNFTILSVLKSRFRFIQIANNFILSQESFYSKQFTEINYKTFFDIQKIFSIYNTDTFIFKKIIESNKYC